MNLGLESEKIEFKKTTGEAKEGIISLASMLNKHGSAVLYFGVKNNGDIVGQEISDKTMREISQWIASAIKPQIIPSIAVELLDGKNVIRVEAEGTERPYSAYGRYYVRSADEDRELTPVQLKKMMREQGESDLITQVSATNQELTFSQLKTLLTAKGLTLNESSFEQNLGFYNSSGQYNLMAELLSDHNDFSVKVVTFAGKDKSEVVRRNEYGFKCLALAMDQVLNYMEAINDTKVTIGTHQREETKLFDFAAFKEAWQNACLHNQWTGYNPPAVYLFRDRIEIISTGGLPTGLTKEEFFKGVSRPVNAKLQKILGQLGYVEQTGHGVPLIISKYGTQAFDIMENFINVTIPFDKTMLQGIDSRPSEPQHLNKAQEAVYLYLREHPNATIPTLVNACGFSDSYIRSILAFLKKNHFIRRVGSNKTGYWQV